MHFARTLYAFCMVPLQDSITIYLWNRRSSYKIQPLNKFCPKHFPSLCSPLTRLYSHYVRYQEGAFRSGGCSFSDNELPPPYHQWFHKTVRNIRHERPGPLCHLQLQYDSVGEMSDMRGGSLYICTSQISSTTMR